MMHVLPQAIAGAIFHHQREVPRADRRDDAGRPELAVRVVAGVHRVDLADGVALVVGEEPEVPHRPGDVVPGLLERLGHVRRVEAGEVVGPLLHEVGEAVDGLGPLDPPHPRPRPLVEGPPGALDRPLGILLGRLGRLRPHLPRPGVPDVEAPAVDRLDLLAVDDVAEELELAHQARLSCWGRHRCRTVDCPSGPVTRRAPSHPP
jgi:hypothetical protein